MFVSGITAMVGEAGYTTMERKTIRPTMEIIGMYGGFQDEGIKTVLPSKAHVKFVARLAPGQVRRMLMYLHLRRTWCISSLTS